LIVTDGVRGESQSLRGVPVGRPLPGVDIMILPLGWAHGDELVPLVNGETGEVFVTGPWLSNGYDQHWLRNRDARVEYQEKMWHRTGDVGHISNGVFIEGRTAHVIRLGDEVVTPVPLEQAVEKIFPRITAAVVSAEVGGETKLVVVVSDGSSTGLVDESMRNAIIQLSSHVDHVLFKRELPVDRRHNSKIDRTLLGSWAAKQLAQE
jgi:acyl-coenzyme A synthetase/AMP-(fatty) acid ligase